MQIELHSTSKIVMIDGVEARVWEGHTKSGIPCHCFIARIAIDESQPETVHDQFKQELKECRKPSAAVDSAYPLYIIL
jgi:hypothetical protein